MPALRLGAGSANRPEGTDPRLQILWVLFVPTVSVHATLLVVAQRGMPDCPQSDRRTSSSSVNIMTLCAASESVGTSRTHRATNLDNRRATRQRETQAENRTTTYSSPITDPKPHKGRKTDVLGQ